MIKTIIVDDEQHCIDRLQMLLQKEHGERIHVLGCFTSVNEGLINILKLKPELLFLDIQIGEKTGFDLLNELGERDFDVIFTTAFDRFAVQAFKFSAVDYLLKPIDNDDLKNAIERLTAHREKLHSAERINVLLSNMNNPAQQKKKIIVPTELGFEIFQTTDIIRCESQVNYTTIFSTNKPKLVVAKTLKEFEEMLEPCGFYRVHNSHLINLGFIQSYHKGKGGSVKLNDGTEIEVSTRRKEDFLKRLAEL